MTHSLAATGDGTSPRGALRLLIDPVFGVIMWGKLFTSSGAWMHTVVAAIAVYAATRSTLIVGLVTAAQFCPQLLLAPLAGRWADRGHTYGQILGGRVLCAVGSGGLGIWFAWEGETGGRYGVHAALIASLLLGAGFAIGGPALQSIVPSLLRPGELPVAMSLNTAPFTVSVVIGPVVGAYVASEFSAAAAFGIAGGFHALFAVLILLVRLPRQRAVHDDADSSIRASLRHIRSDRVLLALLWGIAGLGFGADPSVTLAPALVAELGAESPIIVGVVTGSFGVGAGVGLVLYGPVSRRVSTARLSFAGLGAMATGLLVAGALNLLPLILVGFAATGFGFTLALTSISALVQERSPDRLRGRIMAVWMMALLGARPVAGALAGLVADITSAQTAVLVSVLPVVLVMAMIRPGRLEPAPRRRRQAGRTATRLADVPGSDVALPEPEALR